QRAEPCSARAIATLPDGLTLPTGTLLDRLFLAAPVPRVVPPPLVGVIGGVDRDLLAPHVLTFRIAAPDCLGHTVIAQSPIRRRGYTALDRLIGQRLQASEAVALVQGDK